MDHGRWRDLAAAQAVQESSIRPPRRRILDRNGVVLAKNVAAIDLEVDYRVIPPEPDAKWLKEEAKRRLRTDPNYKNAPDDETRAKLLAEAQRQLLTDLDAMWDFIAVTTGQTREQIDEERGEIVNQVERRRDNNWDKAYQKALEAYRNRPAPRWYERWLGSVPTEPKPEEFQTTIYEQEHTHVLVPALTQEQFNAIQLKQPSLPQIKRDGAMQSVIELNRSERREYPLGTLACHMIGHVSEATRKDLEADRDMNKDDSASALRPGDDLGKEGVEALAEALLRGKRGTIRRTLAGDTVVVSDLEPGKDVTLTIDSRLQERLEAAFKEVDLKDADMDPLDPNAVYKFGPVNGAAIVIDVHTNEILALASVPTYDLNTYREKLNELNDDELNSPLRNRALTSAVEPGSTIKPVIGIGAIASKMIGLTEKVTCNGFPVINGRQYSKPSCWVWSMGKEHGHITGSEPLNPSELDFHEAIKRSCNVYFVTMASKLGLDGISYWMKQFGLGQPTGIGLYEHKGILPDSFRGPIDQRASTAWYAGIGQGCIAVTPIQMANVAATIARDGLRMRPRLVKTEIPTTQPSPVPERYQINLPPGAMKALREGMIDVVNSPAGTGRKIRIHDDGEPDRFIAAKTGSASASVLVRTVRDENGKPVDFDGKHRYIPIPYGSKSNPNPDVPWYRYTTHHDDGSVSGTHSWVIGFAPADNPKVAFCAFVEYGGSGGIAAGSVVRQIVHACIDLGYLQDTHTPSTQPSTQPIDLMIDDVQH
ncbi:MAG: penicillin-binding transpeptidase domain-containing protein [Tepidisphaeraceae bacterium]